VSVGGVQYLIGDNLKVVLEQVFNSKLVSFSSLLDKCTLSLKTTLELKTQPRFSPFSSSLYTSNVLSN
jgi:hypothetical protein